MKALRSRLFATVFQSLLMLAVLIVPQSAMAVAWQAQVGAQSNDLGRRL
jgi:hypothetical protein